jgi:hypothetical protein
LDIRCTSEFFKDLKIPQSEGRVPFEVFEKLTRGCLSIFHEKPCYYLLIIYIKMFETIVFLTYAFIANIPLAKFSWLCYITFYNIVIHRILAVLQSDWLNYSPYISSYTASSEKQDGGPKTT